MTPHDPRRLPLPVWPSAQATSRIDRSPTAAREASVDRIVRVVAIVGITVAWIGAFAVFGHAFATVGSDAWNYLAAGERLNAGHDLYALTSGDRYVLIVPPYWSVPLLSPPPIAVVWRALALLGDGSMYLWWAGGLVACLWLQADALRRGTRAEVVLTLIVSPLLALTAVSGNANAYLVPLLAWSVTRRDRPDLTGAAVAVLAAVKLTPILLLPWVVVRGGIRGFVLASLLVALLTLLGAGPGSIIDWWAGARGAAPSPLSLSQLLQVAPALIAVAGATLAVATALIMRSRDRVVLTAGVVASIVSTPALYFQAIALLAAFPAGLASRRSIPE